ncbi:calsyntenin-2-like [Trichomycterus rosablanca]|uniref:calsyntenin-2-like n=1 Tax=Trichomycterus rosablanca TaxID=2290929 RepID=UPI002F353420
MTTVTVLLILGIWGRGGVLGAGGVNKHKPWIETSYHGVITENMDTVLLDPPLIARDRDAPVPYAGEICKFETYGEEGAFRAEVVNRTSGEGALRARRLIDCEQQKEFRFIIQAFDCGVDHTGAGGKKSHKAVVHVQVDDVNEFSPVFREPAYQASVTEGRIYDSVVQLEAWDQDCSTQYSQICSYEIVTPNTPFAIDRSGNIRNTERLNYSRQNQYTILVSAYDCGQKRSKENVPVLIHVKPACKPGWQGWNKQVEYEPGSGDKQLFPMMHLETCDGPLSSVRVTLELQRSLVGGGCGGGTHSEKSLQRRCDAALGSVNLLPPPGASTNWTASLRTDGAQDQDLIFHFDGKQAAVVPKGVVPRNLTRQFTVATWMKHAAGPAPKGEKEALLCTSDSNGLNNHRFSLYVQNCRLVFLLRRDFLQTETFRPTEFHWKLDQICDKEWHHYVIAVEFPAVTLFVDGVIYEPYLVTSDWPVQPLHTDLQLTVGACWQGRDVDTPHFVQHFRGSLSGLVIHRGKMEIQKIISCLQICKESLDITSLQNLRNGVKFHLNPGQSVLVMEADDVESVTSAMMKVSYVNLMRFISPGLRSIRISTAVQCFEEDSCPSIPDIKVMVMVLEPGKPRISITGTERLTIPASKLRGPNGVAVFKDVHISSASDQNKRDFHAEEVYNLDYCDVLVIGEELNPEQESLQIQHSSLLGKHIAATNSTSGISIYGVDSVVNYEQTIRQVRYRNWNPAGLSQREFRLSCSGLNGRYISNGFTTEIGVVHNSEPAEHVNHMAVQSQYVRPVHQPLVVYSSDHISGTPTVATAVIVICITALVVSVVLAIFRLHAAHQEDLKEEEDQENHLEMDDSSVNITINPMENVNGPQNAEEPKQEDHEEDKDDEELEEDLSCTCSEYSDEEQEEGQEGKVRWDPSSLLY